MSNFNENAPSMEARFTVTITVKSDDIRVISKLLEGMKMVDHYIDDMRTAGAWTYKVERDPEKSFIAAK